MSHSLIHTHECSSRAPYILFVFCISARSLGFLCFGLLQSQLARLFLAIPCTVVPAWIVLLNGTLFLWMLVSTTWHMACGKLALKALVNNVSRFLPCEIRGCLHLAALCALNGPMGLTPWGIADPVTILLDVFACPWHFCARPWFLAILVRTLWETVRFASVSWLCATCDLVPVQIAAL